MITDWLTDPDRAILGWPLAALLAALVLAATRRAWPPTPPRTRVWRALLLTTAMAVPGLVIWLTAGESTGTLAQNALGPDGRGMLHTAAFLASMGLLLGWLIPVGIEGRSLRDMGWVRRRWPLYLLLGAAAGITLACLIRPRVELPEMPGMDAPGSAVAIALLAGPRCLLICLAIGLTVGWVEENVCRGHLLTSLREAGWSPRRALWLQAVVFALYHIPTDLLGPRFAEVTLTRGAGLLAGAIIVRILWGLLFGHLRQRTGSIVPGFALHGFYDGVYFLMSLGPWAALVGGLRL